MENILSHGITLTQLSAFIGGVLTLMSGIGIAVYSIRAGRQARAEELEQQRRDDEYEKFKTLVFTKFDEIYDILSKDGKDFSELKGAFDMLLKICDHNHG